MFRQLCFAVLALFFSFALGQISDDFENGLDTSKWMSYAPGCDQGGSVSLDSTTAHSGKNSVKVTGGSSGYCGHKFFGTTALPPCGNVYVRAKIATALGSGHVTFITMPDPSLGDNKHLRVSGQMSIIEYNRESDDATLPDLSPAGISTTKGLPANTWACFEYHLNWDGTIETWLDGTPIPGLTVKPGVTTPNSNGWGTSYKPAITGVYFGWESYSGDVNTLWYDDIEISASRVGC